MPHENTAKIFSLPEDQSINEPIIDIANNVQQCSTFQPAVAIELNKLVNNKDKILLQNMCREVEQIKRDIFTFIAKKKINDKNKVLTSIVANGYTMLTDSQVATIIYQAFDYVDTHTLARFEYYSTVPMITIKKEAIEVFENFFTIKTKYKDVDIKIPKHSTEIIKDAFKSIIYASLICGTETITLTISCKSPTSRDRNNTKKSQNKYKYKS